MNIWSELKWRFKHGDITEKIILWNILLFVIPWVTVGIVSLFNIQLDIFHWIQLSSDVKLLFYSPWTVITYAFFHASFLHILFNLLVFNFSSRLFLTFFSSRQLLGLYFTAVIVSGIFFVVSYNLFPRFSNSSGFLIGASGAVSAVLFAVATYAPQMEIRLLLIGRVKLWHVAMVFFFLDLIRLASTNAGGHIAHIGGAVFGFIFVKQLQRGVDLGKWFHGVVSFIERFMVRKTSSKGHFKKVYRSSSSQKDNSKVGKTVSSFQPSQTQEKIDLILDKISKSGYDSLSKEEKEFLFKAGKS